MSKCPNVKISFYAMEGVFHLIHLSVIQKIDLYESNHINNY